MACVDPSLAQALSHRCTAFRTSDFLASRIDATLGIADFKPRFRERLRDAAILSDFADQRVHLGAKHAHRHANDNQLGIGGDKRIFVLEPLGIRPTVLPSASFL